MKNLVTVQYVFENEIRETENGEGVILCDNKVFVADQDGIGLYEFQSTSDPKTVIVNLDENGKDYLSGKADLLLALIVA